MSEEWSPPTAPVAQEFRTPRDGLGMLQSAIETHRRAIRDLQGSAPLRQAGVRGEPGMLSSSDFNGDGTRDNLGTKGWMLGSGDGGDSFFVLNGHLVIEELEEQADELAAQAAALAAQDVVINGLIANLSSTVAALAARVSVTQSISTFNTGALPNDSTVHWYGADINITVAVPTGRLLVTVGCAEASLNSGGESVQGRCTFSVPGVVNLGDYTGRNFLATDDPTTAVSSPLVLVRSIALPPGTHTITGKMGAWAAGTSTASVNFLTPFMTVQVTA